MSSCPSLVSESPEEDCPGFLFCFLLFLQHQTITDQNTGIVDIHPNCRDN
jgi:hypothetical protein